MVNHAERAESLENLRKWLKLGVTVNCHLDHVSSSGMTRHIRFSVATIEAGEVRFIWLNFHIARLLGYRKAKRDGLIVTGCGMDMGFSVVYNLSRALFPDGFGVLGRLAEDVPAYSDYDGTRPTTRGEAALMASKGWHFYGRNGDKSGWDDDGGYALKHRWL